jgi:hypothetical protein
MIRSVAGHYPPASFLNVTSHNTQEYLELHSISVLKLTYILSISSKECLDKDYWNRDNLIIVGVACVSVTPPQLSLYQAMEAHRVVRR